MKVGDIVTHLASLEFRVGDNLWYRVDTVQGERIWCLPLWPMRLPIRKSTRLFSMECMREATLEELGELSMLLMEPA